MALQVGDQAPDFELKSTSGDTVRLGDLRGQKVMIVFFPWAFSGTCTAELCAIRDDTARYQDLDATVLGISCDATHTLNAYAAAQGLHHQLLSDHWPHGQVAKAYGVFVEDLGVANRGTFVLDRNSRLAWATVTSIGQPRDEDDYHRVLAGID